MRFFSIGIQPQVIASDLEKKNTDLLAAFSSDLTDVSDLFQTYKDKPVVARNSAPHSGATAWARGLRERIEEPMSKVRDAFRLLSYIIMRRIQCIIV